MAGNISILIDGIDHASGAFKSVGGAMDTLESNATGLISRGLKPLQSIMETGLKVAAGAALGGIVALGAGLASSVGAAADMQQGVADLSANMGASAEETVKLKSLIENLGLDPKLKVTATEAAAAIGMLGTAGTSVSDILGGAARNTVLLANATGADFPTAASIASDVMHLWNIEAKDLAGAVNGITAATIASKFNINDYRLALAAAGGVASSVGVSFDDFNATIAAISPSFASGSDAGTSFKTFLQRLVPSSAPAIDAMKQLGLITAEGGNQFYDAAGNMKDMDEIMGILNKAFSGLSEEQKNQQMSTIFGTDAMRAAMSMSKMTKEQFDALKATMAKTDAEKQAAQRMDTFKGAMEILGGVIDTVKMQIGDKFLPILTELAKKFSNIITGAAPQIVEWAGQFATKLGELITRWLPSLLDRLGEWWLIGKSLASQIPGIVQSVSDFIKVVTNFVQPMIDWVASFTDLKTILIAVAAVFAGAAILALAEFLAAVSPVILIVGGLVAAVIVLKKAWDEDWGGIQEKTKVVIDYLESRFGPLYNAIKEFGVGALGEIATWALGNQTEFTNVGKIWDATKILASTLFSDLVGYVKTNLPNWITNIKAWGTALWDWLAPATVTAVNQLGQWGKQLLGWVVDNLPNWISNIATWAKELWIWIEPSVTAAVTQLGVWGKQLWGWFTTNLPSWISNIKTWAKELWVWIQPSISPAVTQLTAWGKALWEWLSTNAPTWIQTLAKWGIILVEWIGKAVPKAIDALTKWVDDMIMWSDGTGGTKTQEMVNKLGSSMLTALGKVGISLAALGLTVIGDLLINLAAGFLKWIGIDTNVTEMHTHLLGLIDNLKDVLGEHAGLIGGVILAAITPGFLGIASSIVSTVLPALGSFVWAVGTSVFGALGSLASVIWTTAIPALGALLAPFAPVIAIVAVIAAAIVALYLAWTNNFLGIRDKTEAALTAIKGFFANVPGQIAAFATNFYNAASGLVTKIKEGIAQFLNDPAGALGGVLYAVRDKFNAVNDELKKHFGPAAGELVTNIKNGIAQYINDPAGSISTVLGNLRTAFNNQIDGTSGLKNSFFIGARDTVDKLKLGFDAMTTNPVGTVNTVLGQLKTALNNQIDGTSGIKNAFFIGARDAIGQLQAGFNAVTNDPVGAINTLLGKIVSTFNASIGMGGDILKHLLSLGTGLGENLLAGIEKGIQNGIAAVMKAIQGITDALPQWVKDKLGIHSPSTVFAGFGKNMMEGLALGINKAFAVPQLAMDAATAGLQTNLNGLQMEGSAGSGSSSYDASRTTSNTFNVTIPTSGSNQPVDQMQSAYNTLTSLYTS